ncbi:MAG: hypothetical protein L0Y71_01930 [Gemmataceae bacterium]|nr:hypothetical protein [Gemmataceae bacterium]
MRRWSFTILFAILTVTLGLGALGSQEPLKSGPAVGAMLPASFDTLVVNGKVAAGRHHCLVCENALNPAVMIFTREPDKATEQPLAHLLAGLDKILAKEPESLGGFAVFLSPDAHSSVSSEAEVDTQKLLDEAAKRFALVERLKARAKPLKHVVVAAYPDDGPKGYDIPKDAEVTVIFYQRLRVLGNWAFAKGKLTEKAADSILDKVDQTLSKGKKTKGAAE